VKTYILLSYAVNEMPEFTKAQARLCNISVAYEKQLFLRNLKYVNFF